MAAGNTGKGMARDGDTIRLDIPNGTLQLWVEDQELDRRRDHWQQPPPQHSRGVLAKYARLVGSAASGAVCG